MITDDILVWSDGSWCYSDDVEVMRTLGGPCKRIMFGTQEYLDFSNDKGLNDEDL